ncbi:MATE family efflux transporter [Saccharospirillum salsuginis]|uniref:MATE family efflux transporter n=1 Tax=Saccharospirillum salsuginis TaxID=418750 RepID=A0A918NC71_9GAMM|nr:MATE family efflux transporter [Saccharospirillum salsuginis]GGX57037.1 MATE family efflux transporter [Saccharospirillum salsuginis]
MSLQQTQPLPGRRGRAWPRFDRGEASHLVRLATPIMLVALVNMGMSVTDTVMSAAFGADALAAVAVGSDAYSIVFYLAAGILGGLAPFYAQASADGADGRLRVLRTHGWVLWALVSLVAAPLVWFAPDLLARAGLNADLLADGRTYTRAMALTMIPMLAIAVYRNRLTSVEQPGVLLKVTLSALPLNALFNYILMHGVGGWAGFGVTGAGYSSLLVACFIAGCLAVISRRHDGGGLARQLTIDLLWEIIRVGFPIGIATLAEVGLFLGATLYAASFGPDAVAAHAVAIRLAGVTFAVSLGLLQASLVRMARLGADSPAADRKELLITTLGVSLIAGVILCLALVIGAPFIAEGIFPNRIDSQLLTVYLIFLLALMELLEPMGAGACGLMRGRKDTRMPMLFSLLGNWGISAPLAILLASGMQMGVLGIWIGLTAGLVGTVVLMLLWLPRHGR